MIFKKGDTVSVIDEDLKGRVTSTTKTTVAIETEDGFEIEFPKTSVVIEKRLIIEKLPTATELQEKEQKKRKPTIKKSAKQKEQPAMEVDLHMHQLVKSTKGMTKHDMLTYQLDTARHKLEYAIRNRIQRIVFIHGVGEGVLKIELEYLFGRYNNVKFYDANYQKYGLGATEVYIFQNVNP